MPSHDIIVYPNREKPLRVALNAYDLASLHQTAVPGDIATDGKILIGGVDVDAQIGQLNKDMEQNDKDLAANNEALAQLDKDLAQNNKDLADAKKTLAENQQALDQAKQDLAENQKILDQAKKDLAENQQILDQAKKDIAANKETIAQANKDLDDANRRIDDAVSQVEDIKPDLDQAKQDLAAARQDIKTSQDAANKALSDAAGAQSAAQKAQESADAASGAASNAQTTAQGAKTSADEAVKTAQQAAETAKTAQRDGITGSRQEYAVSTSPTTAPTSGWSANPPEWKAGSYIWVRTVITYGDGRTDTTSPVPVTGNTGEAGPAGPQGEQGVPGPAGSGGTAGATSYFHVKYAPNDHPTEGQLSETPDTYIGTYVDFIKDDSTDPAKYTWSRFQGSQGAKGDQGLPGKNGADGRTSYLHVAYATSADGSQGFSVSESAGKTYIGQYVDFTQADSTDPKAYAWTRIKGETGAKGDPGSTGVGVASIVRYYCLSLSKPAKPTAVPPASIWGVDEPGYDRAKKLYTADLVTYTNGVHSWGDVQLSSSYEYAKAAETSARDAIQTATNADTTAKTAQQAAETAKKAASDANVTAGEAKTNATNASKVATQSQATANSAAQAAVSAQTAANQALAATVNLLANPGLETGDMTGWKTGNFTSAQVDKGSTQHSGSYRMIVGGKTNGTGWVNSLDFTAVKGHTYEASAWVWCDSGVASVGIGVQSNSGNWQGVVAVKPSATVTWVRVSHQTTAPADYTDAHLYLGVTLAENQFVRIDDFDLRDVTEAIAAQQAADKAQQTAEAAKTAAANADAKAVKAQATAQGAQTTADSKNKVFTQAAEPSHVGVVPGDLWRQTNASGQVIRELVWNGTAFVAHQLTADSLIVPGTVTTTVIKDGAITTGKLTSSAVTTDKLSANAVTAGKIAANAVTADKIAANSISADKLVITNGSDYCVNPQLQDNAPLIGKAHSYVPASGGKARLLDVRDHTFPYTTAFSVQQGETYLVSCEAMRLKGDRLLNLGLWVTRDGKTMSGSGVSAYQYKQPTDQGAVPADTNWHRYTARVTIPGTSTSGGNVNRAQIYMQIEQGMTGQPAMGSTQWVVGNIHCRRMSDGELIVDGSITAGKIVSGAITTDKLAANSVNADKIVSNSITTDELAVNAVHAENIVANAVTVDKIAANAVNADKITANAVTTAKIVALAVNADKLAANSVTADKIVANSIGSDKIKANSIKADHIQANSIGTDKIIANSIGADKIKSNAIEARHIVANAITADKIAANAIDGKTITGATFKSSSYGTAGKPGWRLTDTELVWWGYGVANLSISSEGKLTAVDLVAKKTLTVQNTSGDGKGDISIDAVTSSGPAMSLGHDQWWSNWTTFALHGATVAKNGSGVAQTPRVCFKGGCVVFEGQIKVNTAADVPVVYLSDITPEFRSDDRDRHYWAWGLKSDGTQAPVMCWIPAGAKQLHINNVVNYTRIDLAPLIIPMT